MADLGKILKDIRYSDLDNDSLNMIIEAVKFARAQNARKAANSLKLGQRVRFNGRNGPVVGTLEQVKIKKAIVLANFTRWNVPLSMLEAAE